MYTVDKYSSRTRRIHSECTLQVHKSCRKFTIKALHVITLVNSVLRKRTMFKLLTIPNSENVPQNPNSNP